MLPLEPPLPEDVGQAAHQRPAGGAGQGGQGVPAAPRSGGGRRPRGAEGGGEEALRGGCAPGGAHGGAAAGEGGVPEEDAAASHGGGDRHPSAYMYIYSSREARWTFIGGQWEPGVG